MEAIELNIFGQRLRNMHLGIEWNAVNAPSVSDPAHLYHWWIVFYFRFFGVSLFRKA